MGIAIFGAGGITWTRVGRNKKVIAEYIRTQLQEDHSSDQMSLKEYIDPFTGQQVKEG